MHGKKCCTAKTICEWLVVVGALNWGLVGAFNFNLVEALLGDGGLAKAVYILVGLAALGMLAHMFHMCTCQKGGGCCEGGKCGRGDMKESAPEESSDEDEGDKM